MHTTVIRQPAIEPVSIEEMKDYLQIEHDAEDGLIAHLIKSAREYVEQYVNRAFITQTRQVKILGVRGRKKRYFLGSAPFLNLERDVLCNNRPYKEYHLIKAMGQAMLCLYRPLQENDQLTVTFSCGYGEHPRDVPEIFRHAILVKVAEMYQNRTGTAKAEAETAYLHDLLGHYQCLRLA